MKFFDIINNKVIIHAEALALPCFNKLWESDKSKEKNKAIEAIRYIVFLHKYDSPYKKNYTHEKAQKILKKEIFGDEKYVLSVEEKECEAGYIELNNTLTKRLLAGAYRQLHGVEKFYNETNNLFENSDDIEVVYSSITKLKTALQTISLLEQTAAGEEAAGGRVRGGDEPNPYEFPKNN
jgi:hypothetical protein